MRILVSATSCRSLMLVNILSKQPRWMPSCTCLLPREGTTERLFIHKSRLQSPSSFSTSTSTFQSPHNRSNDKKKNDHDDQVRLSKLLAVNLGISRREAERWIREGNVSLVGQVVRSPHAVVSWQSLSQRSSGSLQAHGKSVVVHIDPRTKQELVNNSDNQETGTKSNKNISSIDTADTRVWLVHKLAGELVADFDPQGRPCLLERLKQNGLNRKSASGKGRNNSTHQQYHWKAVGRLDMNTEGLVVLTHSGDYARQMELPRNQLHRTYRARLHGLLTDYKLQRIQRGVTIDSVQYAPMLVRVDPVERQRQKRHSSSTNTWLQVTCCQGKNRQIRKVFEYLGLTVTRLIRISYGDYQLQTIPPGMAIPVALKPVEQHKNRGPLFPAHFKRSNSSKDKTKNQQQQQQQSKQQQARPIQWKRMH